MQVRFISLTFSAILVIAGQLPVVAQSGATKALWGTVSDASGATVPGATVTATYLKTQAQRRTTTGADGTFFFVQLTTGEYGISVQAPGFEGTTHKLNYSGVPLQLDVKLAPGAVQTELTVN